MTPAALAEGLESNTRLTPLHVTAEDAADEMCCMWWTCQAIETGNNSG
jgi:hypothetical protein